eukprot:CAMPEP_0201530314 /NCGR_PEP_ID=MMETSP0161_2-20130828/44319_1 /ASSEMBLY_ACC=CAM_ASM_000251 /TAXON_ID=180227 /ORGANISM="Neoparamoeba aestuarina, Strain SoJaBio B1-5/56/2" /LENGTH=181 /DNA_ID=CAMNT_0047932617 /DNA_START=111 /DNA_END=653 /DNA_ORIENTATION=-
MCSSHENIWVGAKNGEIFRFAIQNTQKLMSFNVGNGILALDYCVVRHEIWSISTKKELSAWDSKNGKMQEFAHDHTKHSVIIVSPLGKFMATGETNGNLQIYLPTSSSPSSSITTTTNFHTKDTQPLHTNTPTSPHFTPLKIIEVVSGAEKEGERREGGGGEEGGGLCVVSVDVSGVVGFW